MPYKDKEENRKYQREWARKNSKTYKANQISHQRRKQIVEDAKKHPCIICNKDFNTVVMDLIHVDPTPQKYSVSKLLQHASYKTLRRRLINVLLYVQIVIDYYNMVWWSYQN